MFNESAINIFQTLQHESFVLWFATILGLIVYAILLIFVVWGFGVLVVKIADRVKFKLPCTLSRKHDYKPISPTFCIGEGKFATLCVCEKCGKTKVFK